MWLPTPHLQLVIGFRFSQSKIAKIYSIDHWFHKMLLGNKDLRTYWKIQNILCFAWNFTVNVIISKPKLLTSYTHKILASESLTSCLVWNSYSFTKDKLFKNELLILLNPFKLTPTTLSLSKQKVILRNFLRSHSWLFLVSSSTLLDHIKIRSNWASLLLNSTQNHPIISYKIH